MTAPAGNAAVEAAGASVAAVLARLVASGRLHQADATVIAGAFGWPRDTQATYLALGRLAVTVDDLPGGDWWALVRFLAPEITAEQVGRVRQAGADLELLRSHGLHGLRHFEPGVRLTAVAWSAAVQDRQDQIAAVAREVTAP
jgi:hypothetical protein